MNRPRIGLGRLHVEGTAPERNALGSARPDQPPAGTREAATKRVLAQYQSKRRSRATAPLIALSCALSAAAAVLIVQHHGPRLALSTEPRAPHARLAAPEASSPAVAASSGVRPFVPCTPLAVAAGREPLIDDFEDGDGRAALLEHRAGQWFTFDDGTADHSPRIGAFLTAQRIPGGRGSSQFGLHISGGKFSNWGAIVGVELNPRRCYDASAYAGVQFYARGRGEIQAMVKMTQVVSEEFGGSCSQNCFDGHRRRLELSRNFQLYRVSWDELRQAGFGDPVAFDPRSLFSIEFWVLPEHTPFNFWIDDVSFFARQ